MLIPTGRKYTVTVTATTYKTVHCEKCGCDFVYPMRRRAQGTGHSPLWLDNKGATSRAEQAAQENLAKKLATEINPVPCLDCGRYQADMVTKLKKSKWRWMVVVGWLAIIVSLIAGWIIWLDDHQFIAAFTNTFWGVVLLAGVAMIVATKLRQRAFDPNAAARPPAVQNSNDPRLPLRRRDFDRLVAAAKQSRGEAATSSG
jgi:hypothetical protein